ncbi:MAG TPA: nuclear transport factor 2 family protein [Silvibacterium sp.]|nr:nuclear transport factor 2 family protein [Silvibacterium sp.]
MKSVFFSLAASAVLLGSLAMAQQDAPQQPPEIVQFQKLEDQWSEAIAKRDQYQLELLMSPILVNISSTGEVTTRNQQIAQLYEKAGPQLASMEQRVVNVRTFEDTAVVDGTYIIKWKVNNQVQEERGIFTHVFQHARGNWICVHAQRTAVVEKVDQKQKSASKKSTAELPFHIPLIHQGAQSSQPAPAPGADSKSP